MLVSRNIHIASPVERVFALVADPAARSALNPRLRPIRVEIEGGGPLAEGSVCHFRMQAGNRIVEYRTRVRDFVPLTRIVSLSDSAVPFEVITETRPEESGTRLTHTERFEPTVDMLHQSLADTPRNRMLRFAHWLAIFLDLDTARRLQARLEETLADQLGADVERWLAAIKQHLEAGV